MPAPSKCFREEVSSENKERARDSRQVERLRTLIGIVAPPEFFEKMDWVYEEFASLLDNKENSGFSEKQMRAVENARKIFFRDVKWQIDALKMWRQDVAIGLHENQEATQEKALAAIGNIRLEPVDRKKFSFEEQSYLGS